MSALNCKPGDLAVIVAPYALSGRGSVVKVLRPARHRENLLGAEFTLVYGEFGWVCQGSVTMESGAVERLTAISDGCLRPIRDPGEDARDETLSWKRVPSPSTTKDAEVSNG
jgi:hypothetical protein